MPDIMPVGTIVFDVLVGLVIWTAIFDPGKDTPRAKLAVYYAGVAFAILAGLSQLLITVIKQVNG